ncbi:MAG: hypothetical protein ACJ78X_20835 [Myxococcales bacterium]
MRRAALLSSLLLLGCHPTVDFDLTQSGSGTIPVARGPVGGPVSLTFAIPELQNVNPSNLKGFPGNTAKDHVQSARAKKITLTATDPPGQDLSFLRSVAFSISAGGLPTVQVAHLSPFPAAPSADLQLDDVELAPYLKADSFSITAAVTGTPQQHPITVQADLDVGVTATVF